MDGQIFHDKPMRVNYARGKSDAIAKLDGTFHDQKKQRGEKRKLIETQKKKDNADDERPAKRQKRAKGAKSTEITLDRNMLLNEPNKILFIDNLASDIAQTSDRATVEAVFSTYKGFKEVRFIPGRGWAFAEYETEVQASAAMADLQGYKIGKQGMKITFAKK